MTAGRWARLEQWKWRTIHSRLRRERERFYREPAFAARAARDPAFSSLGSWLQDPAGGACRVLELGCGDGRFVALLDSLGYSVVGVDPIKYESWREFEDSPRVELHAGVRAEKLPFADASFDAVACLGALLYFDDPQQALREIRRVLRPEGRLVLRTVNRLNLYTRATGKRLDPSSRNLYSAAELLRLVERSGFAVRKMFSFGFWPPALTNLWWFLQNVVLPPRFIRMLSAVTPASCRINWTAFAERPLDGDGVTRAAASAPNA